jgi:hypothetical protein
MNNKKFLIIFLCFVLLSMSVLPINKAYAIEKAEAGFVGGTAGFASGCYLGAKAGTFIGSFFFGAGALIGGGIGCALLGAAGTFIGYYYGEKTMSEAAKATSRALAWATFIIAKVFHNILYWLNVYVLAPFINLVADLNPFADNITYAPPNSNTPINAPSPIAVMWNILRNFAYIILVFSALSAGFSWLFNDERTSSKLIFNIIIVALLINFSFVLVKEAFLVVKSFEFGITGGNTEQIGSIIVASLWQRDPIALITMIGENFTQENSDDDIAQAKRNLFEAGGYILIIVLDMIIFIILLMAALLFVGRYIAIILLASLSPIAFVSLTLPEFKFLSEVTSEFKIFNKWLGYFTNWLLVVPIFIILVILGNVLTNNTLGQAIGQSNSDPGTNFMEFIIIFIILISWYLLALRFAKKLSGGAADLAEKIAKSILLGIGAFAVARIATKRGPLVGNALYRAGNFLSNKIPISRFPRLNRLMARPAYGLKNAGSKIMEYSSQKAINQVETEMKLYTDRLKTTNDQGEINSIAARLNNLAQQYKNNSNVLSKINETINNLDRQSFEKIATNPAAFSQLVSGNLDQSTINMLQSKIRDLSKNAKQQILSNPNLLNVFLGLQKQLKDTFNEEIGKMDSEDIIKQIAKGGPQVLNQIAQDQQFLNKVDKATKGVVGAAIRGNATELANAIERMDIDTLRNWSAIRTIVQQARPQDYTQILSTALMDGLEREPHKVLRAARGSSELQNALRAHTFPNFNDAINKLDPQKQDPHLNRLIASVWTPTPPPPQQQNIQFPPSGQPPSNQPPSGGQPPGPQQLSLGI